MIYLAGKILHTIDNQVLLKIPSGAGYLLTVNPNKKYNINDNVEFFVIIDPSIIGPNQKIYALDSFEEWLIMWRMVNQGLAVELVTTIIYDLGIGPLQKSIATHDDALFKRIPGLSLKQIRQIMEIGDSIMNLGRGSSIITTADGEEEKIHSYTAAEFTEKMTQLGYSRTRIVDVISLLKYQDFWGKLPLVDLVKKAMSLIEEGYVQ